MGKKIEPFGAGVEAVENAAEDEKGKKRAVEIRLARRRAEKAEENGQLEKRDAK